MQVSQSIWYQLQKVTYNDAIDRYRELKERFLSEYEIAANKTQKEVEDDFEKQIADSINNDIQTYINAKDNNIIQQLFNDIEQQIAITFDNNKKLKTARTKIRKQYLESKSKGEQAAQELGEELLSENELKNYVISSLSRLNVNSGFSIEDILAQVKSYRNKLIATRKTSAKSYIRSTKGYYQEALVFKAFAQLSEQLETQLSVLPTGDIKVDGKDTLYDTYLRFFETLDKQNFQQIVSEKIDLGYGLQSKSWVAPWVASPSYFNEKYGFGIGSRDNLLQRSGLKDNNKISNLYYWTKGVMFLEKNLTEALGENQVGYILKNGFVWTTELITKFRNNNYFLAFSYQQDKPLSAKIAWTKADTLFSK